MDMDYISQKMQRRFRYLKRKLNQVQEIHEESKTYISYGALVAIKGQIRELEHTAKMLDMEGCLF